MIKDLPGEDGIFSGVADRPARCWASASTTALQSEVRLQIAAPDRLRLSPLHDRRTDGTVGFGGTQEVPPVSLGVDRPRVPEAMTPHLTRRICRRRHCSSRASLRDIVRADSGATPTSGACSDLRQRRSRGTDTLCFPWPRASAAGQDLGRGHRRPARRTIHARHRPGRRRSSTASGSQGGHATRSIADIIVRLRRPAAGPEPAPAASSHGCSPSVHGATDVDTGATRFQLGYRSMYTSSAVARRRSRAAPGASGHDGARTRPRAGHLPALAGSRTTSCSSPAGAWTAVSLRVTSTRSRPCMPIPPEHDQPRRRPDRCIIIHSDAARLLPRPRCRNFQLPAGP